MSLDRLRLEIASLAERYGEEVVLGEVRALALKNAPAASCTIVVNQGMHTIPDHLIVGEKFIFYEGSVDLSSEIALHRFTTSHLERLTVFLKSRKWKKVYLVLSGHVAMCVQVKLAVYRVTHVESVDWVFDGAGNYLKLDIPMRRILTSISPP